MRIAEYTLLLVLIVVASGTTPASASEAVVLLHGFGRSPSGMKILEWKLEADGYEVFNLGYESRAGSIEEIVRSVDEQIRRCCADAATIHFVTHSMGGIVLRAFFESRSIPNAGRAVLLAPPNGGSELADQLVRYPRLERALGPMASKLGTGPDALPATLPPPPIPFGVIAGDHWWNPVGPVFLSGAHDGVVTVESTRLAGMADHLVVPYTHTFLMNASSVVEAIDGFLREGRFPPPGATVEGRESARVSLGR